MTVRQWAIMLVGAFIAGLGVFVGSGVDLKTMEFADMWSPSFAVGVGLASGTSIFQYLSKAPPAIGNMKNQWKGSGKG